MEWMRISFEKSWTVSSKPLVRTNWPYSNVTEFFDLSLSAWCGDNAQRSQGRNIWVEEKRCNVFDKYIIVA